MTNVRPLNRRTALAAGGLTTGAVVAAACGSDPEDNGSAGQPAVNPPDSGSGAGSAGSSAADSSAADSSAADDSTAGGSVSGGTAAGAGGTELAAVDDIPDGGSMIVGKVLLSRSGEDVKAFSSICTHQGCEIKAAGAEADCPCHQSKFNALTGAVINGPATEPLPEVAVSVADGKVLQA